MTRGTETIIKSFCLDWQPKSALGVNLEANVFQCFAAECGQKGDVIDLWAHVNQLSLRDAALDLVCTFNLEPAPGTEKRNG